MNNIGRMNNNSKGLEEMGRHMNHLKKEITETNEKGFQGMNNRDQEIRKATIENKTLIQELKDLRETRTKLHDELKNSSKICDNLKRQINQIRNSATNYNRKESPHRTMIKKGSIKNIPQLPNTNILIRSSSQPLKKGKILKGKNYDTDKIVQFSKNKIGELEEKLEILKIEQRKTSVQLDMMKTQLKEHIMTERCSDPLLEKCLVEY